ncbi:MAG TPA: MFS transporter [Chloroflexota bacterium]|nr:MFS transporter [Chloroflexota bacterium]
MLSLITIVAAVFLGALDQTVIVTVLPAVVVDLQIPFDRIDQAAWIVSGYLLGYTVSLPVMGRFSDLRGRRLGLAIAMTAFSIGSAGCAVAGSLGLLVIARVVQAAGGGALLPIGIAAVSDRFPMSRRPLAIGLVGAVAEAGGVLGPLYGAGIVSWLNWRWIFWINIPLALLLLGGALLGPADAPRRPGKLDLIGAAAIAVALGCLILAVSHNTIEVAGIDARPVLAVLAAVALGVFCWHELRVADPLLDPRLLRQAGLAAALIGGAILGITLIVAMVDVPLYAATVRGASAADGGLLLMRLTGLIPFGAILGGLIGTRYGLAIPTGLGFLATSGGLAMMSNWGQAPSNSYFWISLGLAGLGFGLLIPPLSTSAVNLGGVGREASAAAMFTVARLVGMTIGLAALTAWGLKRFDDLAGVIPLPLPQVGDTAAIAQQRVADFDAAMLVAGAEVYREIFLVGAVVGLLGLGVIRWLWSSESNRSLAR